MMRKRLARKDRGPNLPDSMFSLDLKKLLERDLEVASLICHPEASKIFVCTYDGALICLDVDENMNATVAYETHPFKVPIRKTAITPSRKKLLLGSNDGRLCIVNTDTGKPKLRIDKLFGSDSAITALLGLDEDDRLIAAGNDEGDVKIIDLTQQDKPVLAGFDHFNDSVSDLLHFPYRKTLLCSSTDGSLLVIDLKKNRVAVAPESFEDEILCMAVTSNGDQVACGTALGNVNIFRYNYWGKFQNRLPQHPSQINCLAIDPSDDANLFTGCTDGTVRRISLRNPKKALELVQLDDSIETLSILQSGPGKPWGLVVATCTDGLLHLIPNPTNGADDNEVKIVREKSKSKIPESNGKTAANRQFFADME